MKVQCYAIFDTCSGIYEKPFFSPADDLVKREFQDIACSADHPIAKHPEHYSLWRLGMFDNNTGKLTDELNECLWSAIEAVSQAQVVDKAAQRALTDKINGQEDLEMYTPGLTD